MREEKKLRIEKTQKRGDFVSWGKRWGTLGEAEPPQEILGKQLPKGNRETEFFPKKGRRWRKTKK